MEYHRPGVQRVMKQMADRASHASQLEAVKTNDEAIMIESTLLNRIQDESLATSLDLNQLWMEEADLTSRLDGVRVKITEKEGVLASFMARIMKE
ncbi:hypothetical protein GUJ93_ZPchr0006g40933 [Zizania palustris]|uniref:Uncharacterized protein n=1 Tax=Zizania palustris TaxID=103762 RepID=A0A8J5T2R1_ZIZPA|nr:hypothetical protein GUJ93_ZPchr0006g40933 [Zizania palustris]